MMNERDPQEEAIDVAAAEWVVRCDRGLSGREQAELDRWLAADPRHRRWFERHRASWGAFDALQPGVPAPQPRLAGSRLIRYWFWPAALAAAAAIAALVYIRLSPVPPPAPGFVTRDIVASADGTTQVLSDGSVVDLRPGAAMSIAFDRAERGIVLRRGEAQFHVAKNAQWPFIVHASGVAVRAVGTAFDVQVDAAAVAVLVTEGHVEVKAHVTGLPTQPCQLLAGQRAVVSLQAASPAPAPVKATAEQLGRTVGWQSRWLEFDSAPLPQVIAQFNRYNHVQMRIADHSLEALPIVASFHANNVDGFVRLLRMTAGVQATRHGDVITLAAGAPTAIR